MKKILLNSLIIMLFTTAMVHAYGLSIGSGTTFSLGSATLSLAGDWSNAGTFTAGSGTVILNGSSGNQTITNSNGETFNNLTINKAADDVQLANNITVNGTITCTSGDLDLNGNVLTLSGTLSETAGNTVKGTSGYITCSSDLDAPSGANPHGIGVTITSSANLGTTTIQRGHAAQSGAGNTGITRYFDITPTNNASLDVTLVFSYDESELNSHTESELTAFRSGNSGSSWSSISGTLDSDANTVTSGGLTTLSLFTLASTSSPLSSGIIRLQAKIFMEGAYDTGTHQMGVSLNGSIPTTSPYSEDVRSVSSIPATITDWVLVQLRSVATGAAIASKSAFLNQDGNIVADDGTTGYIGLTAAEGNYYIVISHRNHLAVMSDEVHSLNEISSTLYDFTTDASTAYDKYYGGEAALLETGVYGMFCGDPNASGGVNATDYLTVKGQSGSSGYYIEDCNLSGSVNATDYLVIKPNSGKNTQLP